MATRSSATDTSSLSPCLPVSLSPCLPVSLSPCLPVSLSPCLPVSLSPCLPVSLSPCLPVSLSPCLPVSLSPCLRCRAYPAPIRDHRRAIPTIRGRSPLAHLPMPSGNALSSNGNDDLRPKGR